MREEREYQLKAPGLVLEALNEGHRRICIISPTGSGKTAVSDLIVQDDGIRDFLGVYDRPINIVFATHRQRLLKQAADHYSEFKSVNITPWMVSKGTVNDVIPSDTDLVIVDEAHHESMATFQLQLESLTKAPLIGLTATKDRPDRKLLKFSKFIELISRKEAVEEGYLAQAIVHSFVVPSSWCRIEMAAEIAEILKEDLGQTMVFFHKKEQARQFQTHLNKRNLTSDIMVDLSEDHLNQKLDDFQQKKHQFNISCMKLGEGVDVKGCEGTILARRVGSGSLLNQMIGRSSRPDCSCTIAEMVDPLGGNLVATDIVTNPKEHYLWYKVKGEWRVHRKV